MVVDVARYGRDKTVFNFFDGLESYTRISFSEQGTDKTIHQIRDFARDEQLPYSHILIDEDGVGGGVVDQLTSVKGLMGGVNSNPNPNGA